MNKVTTTKDFTKRWRQLIKSGKRVQYNKVNTAFTEGQRDGIISSLNRTSHGESRLSNIEKYDLSDGYRLVVQLIDPVKNHRVCLFVGTHDETEAWLNTHANYKYVQRGSDQEFSFIPITTDRDKPQIVPPPSENLTEIEMDIPIFSRLAESDWDILGVPSEQAQRLLTLTPFSTLEGALKMLEEMLQISQKAKDTIFDLVALALEGDLRGFQNRIEVIRGYAEQLPQDEVSDAFSDVPVSEEFITFEDHDLLAEFQELAGSSSWREWLTYLHPSQYKLVNVHYNGPARIRGVSGSGKTCIAVHRAKCLAKRYNQLIFMVTFNQSLKELLKQLTKDLCGIEQQHIHHFTIQELAKGMLSELVPRSDYTIWVAKDELRRSAVNDAIQSLKSSPVLENILAKQEGWRFVKEEIAFIRSHYLPLTRRSSYLVGDRIGRKTPLNQKQREIMLDIVAEYERTLKEQNVEDHAGIVIQAIEHLLTAQEDTSQMEITMMPRCIIVDEMQDFSENELRFLAILGGGNKTDNLFLVGDGAQKIYQRSFSLRSIGIDVTGRSRILKKNYRNTRQIIEAAYQLIANYDFDDIDSENTGKPEGPDYPSREGKLPIFIKFPNEDIEADWIATEIKRLTERGLASPGEILVLAGSPRIRSNIMSSLDEKKVENCELREDVAIDSKRVKVSTIESAKGHESPYVFVAGLVEGIVPWHNVDDDGERLHASRLYVAMTRARDELTMTWSMIGESKQDQTPSRYLSAIQNKCEEFAFRSGRLMPLSVRERL